MALGDDVIRAADGLQAEIDRLRGVGADNLDPSELDGLQQQVDALRETAEQGDQGDGYGQPADLTQQQAVDPNTGQPVQQVGQPIAPDQQAQPAQAAQPAEASPQEPGAAAGQSPDAGTAQPAPTSTGDPAAQAQVAAQEAARAAQAAQQAAQQAQQGQ